MTGSTQSDIVGGQRPDKARNTPEGRASDFAAALAPALAAALNPILTSRTAAEREMKNATDTLRLVIDQQKRSYAVTETLARQMSGVQTAVATPPMNLPPSRSALDTGYGDRSATSTWLPDGRTAPPGLTPPPPPGNFGAAFPEGHDAPQVRSNYDYLAHGRGYSVGQLRTDVGRSIGRTISGARFGPPLQQSSTGQWMRIDPATGEVAAQATESEISRFAVANKIRSVAGGVAEQGVAKGLINALPKGFGPALGIAGAAYAVGNKALDFAEGQREQNAYYQSVSGGSNLSGFRARFDQGLFGLSQRGVMGGAQADQLYRGVYAAVGDQQGRQDALELGAESFRKFGMSITDSLTLIETAAKTGNENLAGVADALDKVTAAAKGANRNADEARKDFAQSYSTTAPTLVGAGTAANVSSATTVIKSALGEQFKNVDFSGVFSQDQVARLAAGTGKTYGQYLYANQGLSGSGQLLSDKQAQIKQMVRAQLGQKGLAVIAQYRKDRGVTGALSAAQANEIAGLLEQAGILLDPRGIINLFGALGLAISDPNDAIPMLVQFGDDNSLGNALGAQAADLKKQYQVQSVGAGGLSNADVASNLGINVVTQGGKSFINQGSTVSPSFTDVADLGQSKFSTAAELYYQYATQKGKEYNPLVAKVIKEDPNAKFTINGKSMSLLEAMKAAPDQIANGSAIYASGDNAGRSINDVGTGMSSGAQGSGGSNNTLRIWFDASGAKASLNGKELTAGAESTLVLGTALPNGNGG